MVGQPAVGGDGEGKPIRLGRRAGWVYFFAVKLKITQYPPPCISYANVHNYYSPYTYCSLDKGVACAQHIQLPTHTCAGQMC